MTVAARWVAIVATAPSPASSPLHMSRLTRSLLTGRAIYNTFAWLPSAPGALPFYRAMAGALSVVASSPPQMASTTSDFARSSSSSVRGMRSKIHAVSSCSMAP